MPKKRKTSLGSGRIYHAKGARASFRDAYELLARSVKHAKAGECLKAQEALVIGNRDYAKFLTEFMHAVGKSRTHGYSVMSAPKQRAILSTLSTNAFEAVKKKCLR